MDTGLTGKRGLITGARTGLGQFAREMALHAAAVTFLASSHADISGADIRVDGGIVRTVS